MRILFIGHAASLSGAPLVLLNLVKWISQHHPEVVMDILLIEKGDYVPQYEALFNKVILASPSIPTSVSKKVLNRVDKYLNITYESKVLKEIKQGNYDVVFCNTIITLDWGIKVKDLFGNIKMMLHVHELNAAIRILEPEFKTKVSRVDTIIGVSEAVNQNLIDQYAVDPARLKLVYEFIDLPDITTVAPKKQSDTFKIGASGFVDWRKGYDLFLLVAYQYRKKFPDQKVFFQWVGHVPSDLEIVISEDIRKLGLSEYVLFSGKTFKPLDEFNSFDVFLMLSREDPFPLVCLEAGSLGKPIICFEKGGGIPELIREGGGRIIPYQDVNEMVLAINEYATNALQVATDGRYISEKAKTYSTHLLAPEVYKIIEKNSSK